MSALATALIITVTSWPALGISLNPLDAVGQGIFNGASDHLGDQLRDAIGNLNGVLQQSIGKFLEGWNDSLGKLDGILSGNLEKVFSGLDVTLTDMYALEQKLAADTKANVDHLLSSSVVVFGVEWPRGNLELLRYVLLAAIALLGLAAIYRTATQSLDLNPHRLIWRVGGVAAFVFVSGSIVYWYFGGKIAAATLPAVTSATAGANIAEGDGDYKKALNSRATLALAFPDNRIHGYRYHRALFLVGYHMVAVTPNSMAEQLVQMNKQVAAMDQAETYTKVLARELNLFHLAAFSSYGVGKFSGTTRANYVTAAEKAWNDFVIDQCSVPNPNQRQRDMAVMAGFAYVRATIEGDNVAAPSTRFRKVQDALNQLQECVQNDSSAVKRLDIAVRTTMAQIDSLVASKSDVKKGQLPDEIDKLWQRVGQPLLTLHEIDSGPAAAKVRAAVTDAKAQDYRVNSLVASEPPPQICLPMVNIRVMNATVPIPDNTRPKYNLPCRTPDQVIANPEHASWASSLGNARADLRKRQEKLATGIREFVQAEEGRATTELGFGPAGRVMVRNAAAMIVSDASQDWDLANAYEAWQAANSGCLLGIAPFICVLPDLTLTVQAMASGKTKEELLAAFRSNFECTAIRADKSLLVYVLRERSSKNWLEGVRQVSCKNLGPRDGYLRASEVTSGLYRDVKYGG